MQATATNYTTEGILATLGYPNPLAAARQQARMILMGRLTRYEAEVQRYERTWDCTLDEMRARYEQHGDEDSDADDAYLDWRWYADAMETIQAQLAALTAR